MNRPLFAARPLPGFDPVAAQVLKLLVSQADADEPTIAETLGATVPELRAALAALERDRLVVRVEGTVDRWAALPPRAALSTLLAQRRTELARWEQHVDQLEDDYLSAIGRRARAPHVEAVVKPEQVGAVYEQLLQGATSEILHLARPPYVSSTQRPAGSAADIPLQPGVTERSIYERSSFGTALSLRTVELGVARGGTHRLLDDVPLKLVLIDRRVALLPNDPDDPLSGSLVVHAPGIVHALVELFENLWSRASRAFPETLADRTLPPRTHEVLGLMAAGLTDDAIGRVLGVSRRTVQKHISDLAETLGVRTRFQIALVAAQRGLLGTEPDETVAHSA
ncbi:helix-turn-helix transcriptional regulator [Xylanimonas sp. McL0601]|uniref:helix-turn-helix transcriptional regulator n=1 Tax=Xylanimonas sp. McL0601 TaxID=3414739 RepID=UPI003CF71281